MVLPVFEKNYPKENESNKLAPSGTTSLVKRLWHGQNQNCKQLKYTASYFISALIRTSSTLFSATSVSNGIGTTMSIFIVGLGPKHFLRVITPTITQTTNCRPTV